MAFSFGPDGVKGNNNFYPYDNGGTESGNYAVSSGNTDSGWVFLGNHQGGNPYPKKYYKISQADNTQGTLEYEIWNNGDANYEAGGLHLIRINQWNASQGFHTSAFIRCLGGNRTDTYIHTYRNSNGIWVYPGFIWGSFYIRRRGRDDRAWPSASYCAVANDGPLDTATSSSLPSGGVTVTADGGYDIESSGTRNG